MKKQNSTEHAPSIWLQILIVFALTLPLLLLLFIPNRSNGSPVAWLFAVIVLFNIAILWLLLRRSGRDAPAQVEAPPRILMGEDIPAVVHQVLSVHTATEETNGIQIFRGKLREKPEDAFEKLKAGLKDRSVPLLQADQPAGHAIVLIPRPLEEMIAERKNRLWINWVLFGLTFVTTTWAGALQQGVDLLKEPARFVVGLPYSVALMAILGFHELGHYFTARHYKMNVTPPYFIPVPFALGTFGAFIQMRSPPENRRSLFDVAVAGPLAGLVLALPALFFGLQHSTAFPSGLRTADTFFGGLISNSIIFTAIAKLSLGEQIGENTVLQLSPLAFAGWLGLLVTALNLLPIGQLDGGHIARAIFGSRIGQFISSATMWTLFLLAIFVFPSLLFWAIIVFFLARQSNPPLNDLTPVSTGRRCVGILTFLILVLIVAPMPKWFW